MTDPITTPAQMREAAALLATSFLVGDPQNGVPLRNPMAHEIAAAIRALPVAEPVSGRDAIRPHLIAERMRWWSPEYPGQTPPTLAVWWRDEPEDGLSGFDTQQDRDAFYRGEPGPFIRRITGNEFPQLPCADNRALIREAMGAFENAMGHLDTPISRRKIGIDPNEEWLLDALATLAKLRAHLGEME